MKKTLNSDQAKRDTVYAGERERVGNFVFDETVADVFADMIKRSVPGYVTVLKMTGMFASRYVQPGTTCYDLGCSLGAGSLAVAHGVEGVDCKIVAVDNAPAMIEKCRSNLKESNYTTPINLHCMDVQSIDIQHASLVLLNYTLQFIEPAGRPALLQKIYNGLVPGGVLLLSEKIVFSDQVEQQLMADLHLDYKRANGYSELEISQKRTALENVLIPDTLDTHRQRLRAAGFSTVSLWFQSLNFISLLAQK